MIERVTLNDLEAESAPALATNIAALKEVFPAVFMDGKIDFDALRQLLGEEVDDGDERYGLNWAGKRRARRLALTPSTATLLPAPEDSVDWDTTQNLVIEGDNLEVLKLLQKSYAGKVKLIYIDPPYNTGSDFVYPDDFRDTIASYLSLTGQKGTDRRLTSNVETSGRFHTDWLNMMLPRLLLARNLLRDDGAIFITIDDTESHHLHMICNEVFGEENFIVPIVWQKRITPENRRAFSVEHDYVLCYAKSAETFAETRRLLPMTDEARNRYRNPDNDPRGDWLSVPAIAQAGHGTKSQFYKLKSPDGRVIDPPSGCCWRYTEDRMAREIADNRIWFGSSGRGAPRIKRFLSETRQGITPSTLWFAEDVGANEHAKKELSKLNDGHVIFDNPKPTGLVRRMLHIGTEPSNGDIILDFFAGSGTTGHAVASQNVSDGGDRRYILVQLPEPLSPDNSDQAAAAAFCDALGASRNIAELTKERLRRAAAQLANEHPEARTDLGFRVYKLATSNLRAWQPGEDLEADLLAAADNVEHGRTEQDLLTELLLKQGIDLTEPMLSETIAGVPVHAMGGGVLVVCLAPVAAGKAEELADGIADWIEALNPIASATVFFRDSGFESDVAKANVAAILEQRLDAKLLKVRSL
jgi:adenine-specific DNA-methyltransferase